MSPLNMNMTTTVLEELQKSPIPPNTIAVDVYEPPSYQSTSVARDMHKLTRFGRTSNITVLLEDTTNNADYAQGVFAWAIFMLVLFVVWSTTLLICKCLGQYRVGFVSGWPPLDPSLKHDKRIRRQEQQEPQNRCANKKNQSTAKGDNSQGPQISAMDENEGNHDPDESHYGSSIFVSSEESSSVSSSSSTSSAEVSSSVGHLSMGRVSLNSGREMDLHNVFIDAMTPQQQQQQPFPTPTSANFRQASQGDMNLETLACMQPSPGESALSQPSPSTTTHAGSSTNSRSSPPPSVHLSARFATLPSNNNIHNNNHYLDGPPPKLPFMVRDEAACDPNENEFKTLRTPSIQQKRTGDGGVSPYPQQQQQQQQLQSLKNNSTFMSNPANVSLLISSMKEESSKKRNLNKNNNNMNSNNNTAAAAAAETTINTKGQQKEQQDLGKETVGDQHDGTSTPAKTKPAMMSTIPATAIIIGNDTARGDNNNNDDDDDVTATTNSEESSDLSQQPTILHTNQGCAQSPESAPSQLSSKAADTTPIATNTGLVELASQHASPESIALLLSSVQKETTNDKSIHNSNMSSSMSSSMSTTNYKSEQQIMDQVGVMAPSPLPNATNNTNYTPSKEDGSAVPTFTNNMGGETTFDSPATGSAAEQLELERIRSEAHAATHTIMMDHLNSFLHETPNGTYEEWIADLHPENAQSKRNLVNGKRIDHRFYMRDSHHRNIWNDSIVPGEKREIAPERSYCDGDNNGGDTFEDEPLLATMSTKTLPYDNAMLDGEALERARIRRNRFLLASRVIVLISCIAILISSFIFLFKGVRSLAQSLKDVESSIIAVEDVTKDGISTLDKYFYKAKQARSYADDFFTDGSAFCFEKRDDAVRICDADNAFDLDGTSTESECKVASIQKSIEDLRYRYEALKSNIFEEAMNLRTDLDEILDTADEVKDSLNGFNWAWGLSTAFAVTLDAIVCTIMYDVIQTWKGNKGCMSKWHFDKFLVPLFVLNVIFMWIFASLFVSGAVITSDFCYDSPDTFIKQVLEKKQEDFSPYTVNLLTYYIDGCADSSNPVKRVLDNLGNEAIKIAYIITAGHTVLSNLEAIDSDVATNFCGKDLGPFEVGATFFDATFHTLLEIVEDVRELMFCDNWNPIYTSIVHDAICYEGVTGLSWIYSSLSTIGFFGMVILTFRYVLWPDTLEEESRCTPPGRDNDEDIANDNNENKWMSSMRQRCCARKPRIPRTVIMSSRASNSPSSKTNTL